LDLMRTMQQISPQQYQTDAYFSVFLCCHKWSLNRRELGRSATLERLLFKVCKKNQNNLLRALLQERKI